MRPRATVPLTLLLAILTTPGSGFATEPGPRVQQHQYALRFGPGNQKTGECRAIFERIQRGLSSGSVTLFSPDLASQVFVNLRGGESGYYSASQAHYLLENYLRVRKFSRFTFSTIDESGENPYATGSVTFNFRGSREIAQVYVSLTSSGNRWMITQINIY